MFCVVCKFAAKIDTHLFGCLLFFFFLDYYPAGGVNFENGNIENKTASFIVPPRRDEPREQTFCLQTFPTAHRFHSDSAFRRPFLQRPALFKQK